MTTRTSAVYRGVFFLSFAALASACNTGGDTAASGNSEGKAEVSAETKAVNASKPVSAEVRLEARPAPAQPQADLAAKPAPAQGELKAAAPAAVPGQPQLDLAASQLAEASARLNALAAGATVEAKGDPSGNPSLKVNQNGNTVVDAKVQAGNPSLKAGGLIDANVQAGKPSLGGLTPPAPSTPPATK
jgi:hypothetical protein